MSIAVNEISLNHLKTLTLADYISLTQPSEIFPITCQITETTFRLAKQCRVNSHDQISTSITSKPTKSEIELVLFSETSFQQLLTITQQCHVEITAITAINHRNALVSYRFSVHCENIDEAKAQLASIALTEKIEAALIKNAPKLHQAGVLVMDMDSTTIEIECIDEIALLAGVGEEVAAVTEQAMQGELDFAQSLHQRVSKLAGSPESILAEVAKNIPLMNGLEKLIAELKQYHWRIAIASGGFTYFADHLKDMLNLDAAHANVLEIVDNTLTGKVLGNVVDAQAKADCLLSLQQQYQLPFQQTVAMGDGANDLVMMNAAHFGVAFHAKPIVLKQADSAINFSGLDCLLHWLA
ncbi:MULTISPECIES: phosphoserine phosphatase SerB [Thalassotalea]|uniref:Phosphoserine phosphatase n=1 Tax=Thalassotalea castellviae TaxID=3075612 RepID=A0ABU3A541_9GAMM|nr:phosphoserine phosphatase SerB [Thalassotalea sp. W431]MDT0604652.1 phosphoserine phosphatase SerB [Thalassotalea sp. W431]